MSRKYIAIMAVFFSAAPCLIGCGSKAIAASAVTTTTTTEATTTAIQTTAITLPAEFKRFIQEPWTVRMPDGALITLPKYTYVYTDSRTTEVTALIRSDGSRLDLSDHSLRNVANLIFDKDGYLSSIQYRVLTTATTKPAATAASTESESTTAETQATSTELTTQATMPADTSPVTTQPQTTIPVSPTTTTTTPVTTPTAVPTEPQTRAETTPAETQTATTAAASSTTAGSAQNVEKR